MKAAEELDRMLAGEPVEASEDVRELAQLAALLQGAWQGSPTPASTTRVRTAALAAFHETAAAATVPSIVRSRPSGGRRLVARMALVAALVAGLPTAAWAASEDSLPGEVLYPVKRGFEEFRLVLAGDAASEAQVLLGMIEERLEEAVLAFGQGLDASTEEALAGYEDAMLRFQSSIAQAQSEGLPVAALIEEADALDAIHSELFEEETVPTVVPPEVPVPAAESAGDGKNDGKGKAKGKAGNGNGKPKGHRGQGGNPGGSGGGGGSSSGGSGGSSGGGSGGNTGGNTGAGGGGGGNGGGVGDGKQEDPPAPAEEDDEDDEGEESGSDVGSGSGHGTGDGEGLGHEIGKGKGHDKHGDDEG